MESHRVRHNLATEHARTEAAHSQEWEHSGPLGDTSQFVAIRKTMNPPEPTMDQREGGGTVQDIWQLEAMDL